jgi:uncharacterized protein (TIGR02271 family)
MPTFTALFNNRNDAEQAQAELAQLGLSTSDVSIHDQQSAGVSTSGGGGDEGGFFGSLRDMFVPDEDSETYGEGLRRGHVLLTVRASDERAEQVHQALESSRAVDVDESASSWRNQGWSGPSTGNRQAFGGTTGTTTDTGRSDQVIPIVEEQLAVGKREVNRGGVRVRSYVKETPVHEQVSLREEHVDVERRPVNQPLQASALGDAFQERTIEMTETAEEALVAKNARVVEEVAIHKEVGSHVEQIDDTVRRTDVDVERLSDTDRTGSGERGAMFRDEDRTDRR